MFGAVVFSKIYKNRSINFDKVFLYSKKIIISWFSLEGKFSFVHPPFRLLTQPAFTCSKLTKEIVSLFNKNSVFTVNR